MAASLAIAVVALTSCVRPEPIPRDAAYDDIRRVIALLDDVAAEYPRSVADGRVIDAPRMKVVESMLHDARLFAQRFPADDRRLLDELATVAATHRAPAAFRDRARALRQELVERYGMVLAPAAPPDRARAQALWDWLCAGCHGVVGMGDGPQALTMSPEPKDFHETAFMSELAPSRAYSQIADGVRGTAMPQWGMFSRSERWGLAFLVFSFQHEPAAVARGRVLVALHAIPSSMSAVSDRTDRELVEAMRHRGFSEQQATDILAYLRAEAPFVWAQGPLVAARRTLGDLATSYPARGPRPSQLLATARDLLEPWLVAIRAARPATAAALEQRLGELSRSLDAEVRDDLLERQVALMGPLLDDAELVIGTPTPWHGALRLAVEWLLAASIALGSSLRGRGPERSSLAAGVLGPGFARMTALGGLALSAATAGLIATAPLAMFRLIAIAALIVACAVTTRHASLVRVALLALLVGSVAGPLAGGLVGTSARAVVIAVVGAGIVAGYALRAVPRLGSAVTVTAYALAGASTAARAVETLCGPTLRIPRIEALGLLPSIAALATAMVVALLLAGLVARDARSSSGPA